MEKSVTTLSLLKEMYNFDTIAFTGSSGSGLAYILSYALKTPLILVRKQSDNNHSGLPFEGNMDVKKYLIVDDIMSSGNTVANIISLLYRKMPHAKCAAIFLYSGYREMRLNLNWGPEFPVIPVHSNNSIKYPESYADYMSFHKIL